MIPPNLFPLTAIKRWKQLPKLNYSIQKHIKYRKSQFLTWFTSIISRSWLSSTDQLEAQKLGLEPLLTSTHRATISSGERPLKLRLTVMATSQTLRRLTKTSGWHKISRVALDSQDLSLSRASSAWVGSLERYTSWRIPRNQQMCRELGFILKMRPWLRCRKERLIRPSKWITSYRFHSEMAREPDTNSALNQVSIDTRDASRSKRTILSPGSE